MNCNKYFSVFKCVFFTCIGFISIYLMYFPQPLLSIFCLLIIFQINKRGLGACASKRELKFSIIMGMVLALSIVLGKNLVESNSTHIASAQTLLLFLCLCPLMINVMKLFFTMDISLQSEKKLLGIGHKKIFIVCWLLLFITYIPVLLAFYPGIVTYDVHDQFQQVLSNEYSLKHPFIHTLFMGTILKTVYRITGEWNSGVFIHSLIQMLVMTGTFSYVSTWIYKFSKSKKLFIAVALFFMILPIHPLFAITTTKDILFSAVVSIVVIKLIEISLNVFFINNNIKKIILLSVLFFIMFIFRNNAIYSVILWLPILFVSNYGEGGGRRINKKVLISVIFAAGLLILYNYALHNYIGASDGPKAEMYSVPIQQMARVYNRKFDELSETDKESLEALIWGGTDTLVKYEPRKSDVIKDCFIQDVFDSNKIEYITLWLKWGSQYPLVYLDAWMNLINGYFCIDDELPDKETYRTYIEIRCDAFNEMKLHFSSKNSRLFNWYDSLFREGSCQKTPFLSIVCQLAFYDWALLLVFVYVWQKKKYHLLPPLALLIAIFVTLLLGPVAILRYIYPFIICFPLVVFILIECSSEMQRE